MKCSWVTTNARSHPESTASYAGSYLELIKSECISGLGFQPGPTGPVSQLSSCPNTMPASKDFPKPAGCHKASKHRDCSRKGSTQPEHCAQKKQPQTGSVKPRLCAVPRGHRQCKVEGRHGQGGPGGVTVVYQGGSLSPQPSSSSFTKHVVAHHPASQALGLHPSGSHALFAPFHLLKGSLSGREGRTERSCTQWFTLK